MKVCIYLKLPWVQKTETVIRKITSVCNPQGLGWKTCRDQAGRLNILGVSLILAGFFCEIIYNIALILRLNG